MLSTSTQQSQHTNISNADSSSTRSDADSSAVHKHKYLSLLPLLGMSVPFTLISQLIQSVSDADSIWASPYPGLLAICIIVIFIGHFKSKIFDHTGLIHVADYVAAVFRLISTIMVISNIFSPTSNGVIIGITIGGAGIAWMYLHYGFLYTHFEIRQAIGFIAISVTISGILKVQFTIFPTILVVICDIILIILCVISLHYCTCQREFNIPVKHINHQDKQHIDAVLILALIIISATLGFLYNLDGLSLISATNSYIFGFALEAIAAFLVFWWVYL